MKLHEIIEQVSRKTIAIIEPSEVIGQAYMHFLQTKFNINALTSRNPQDLKAQLREQPTPSGFLSAIFIEHAYTCHPFDGLSIAGQIQQGLFDDAYTGARSTPIAILSVTPQLLRAADCPFPVINSNDDAMNNFLSQPEGDVPPEFMRFINVLAL